MDLLLLASGLVLAADPLRAVPRIRVARSSRRGVLAVLVAACIVVCVPSAAVAVKPGDLGPAFGSGGKTTVGLGGVGVAHAAGVQPDGGVGAAGGDLSQLPPPDAPQCQGSVLAVVDGGWGCVRVAGIDDKLLPAAADLPGYRAAGGGSGVARAALGDPVSRALRRARAQGAAFRAGSRGLSLGVFTFASSRSAGSALRGVARGRRRVTLVTGVSGLLRQRSTRRATDVAVVFPVGQAIGTVRLRARGRHAGASAIATSYAKVLAARLRRVLALTPWQRTVDRIGPDGSITPDVALQGFTLVYGPLPGVRRPAGPGGVPPSATVAIDMVARVWDQLSAAQHAAIDRVLGAPHDASSPRVARATDAVLTPSPRYQALADKYNAIYRAKLPSAPPVTIKAFTLSEDVTAETTGGKAFADALPVNANGEWGKGPVAYCRVRVTPFGQAQGGQFQELVLAHEIFHCFQNALAPNSVFLPLWIREGTADWAAVTVDPVPASVGAGPFKLYLATVNRSLFSRAYDGSGFWGRADEVAGKGSLWAKMPGILTAGNAAAYVLAGGANDGFVSTWASASLRFPAGGSAWNQTNPYKLSLTEVGAPVEAVGSGATLASSPYAVELYLVVPDGDAPMISVVSSAGRLRAAAGGQGDLGVISGQRWLCYGGDCRCPPGTKGEVPAHQNVRGTGPLYLGLTGGNHAGGARVSYHSLDEWCKEPESGGGGGGGGGRGRRPGLEVHGLTSDSPILGRITSGSCSFVGKAFRAVGSGSGYRFEMRIAGARRPGQYIIPNNDSGTFVKLRRGGTNYSTVGRNTEILGTTGPRVAGFAIIQARRVRQGKRTVVRYQIAVGIDDLVSGGKPGVALIPGPGGLTC